MTTNKKYSVINIAPFVDILLILFVIIISVSTFTEDNSEEILKLREQNEILKEQLQKVKKEVGGFSIVISKNKVYIGSSEETKGLELSLNDLKDIQRGFSGNFYISYTKSDEDLYKKILETLEIKEKKSAKDLLNE